MDFFCLSLRLEVARTEHRTQGTKYGKGQSDAPRRERNHTAESARKNAGKRDNVKGERLLAIGERNTRPTALLRRVAMFTSDPY